MNDRAAPFILLVEDEPADAHLVRLGLRESHIGANLHHVSDGQAALDYLYAPNHRRPSLILLDLNMPRMNGLECLAALKNDRALADIPVVVLTTSAAERDITAARTAGAIAFLTKPVDVRQFFAAIDSLKRYLQ
jgi:CheY-like chemotaxis protein